MKGITGVATAILAFGAVGAIACSHNLRRDYVGRGVAGIQPRGNPAVTIAARVVPVSAGTYSADLTFDLPRAQVVDWKVRCPGNSVTGSLGEAVSDRHEHDHEQRPVVANAVLAPPGTAIRVRANPYVVIPIPAASFHRVSTTVDLHVSFAGTCEVTAATDDPDVQGSFEVTRVRDLDEEARAPEIAAMAAVESSARIDRRRVIAQLVVDGAELDARENRLAVIAGECHGVRDQVRRQLVAMGGVERTPKPEPLDEVQPAKPSASATWSAGTWTWTGARWTWAKGRWRDPRTKTARPPRRVLVRRPVVVVPGPPPPPVIVIPVR